MSTRQLWANRLQETLDETLDMSLAYRVSTIKHIEWLRSTKTLDQIEKEVTDTITALDNAMTTCRRHMELAETDSLAGKVSEDILDALVQQFYHLDAQIKYHDHFISLIGVIK